jgi:hypothetical protein
VAAATAEGDETRGFDKVPMDTPGAYRLVDRDTGRSVIVWGGTDDSDEASMPSPAVLSRTTDRRHSQGYNHTTPPLTETHCLIPGSCLEQIECSHFGFALFLHIPCTREESRMQRIFSFRKMRLCHRFTIDISRSDIVKMSALRQKYEV